MYPGTVGGSFPVPSMEGPSLSESSPASNLHFPVPFPDVIWLWASPGTGLSLLPARALLTAPVKSLLLFSSQDHSWSTLAIRDWFRNSGGEDAAGRKNYP